MIAAIIFWTSILAGFHSYVLYPLIMRLLAIGKKQNTLIYQQNDELPHLYVIMAVHNEEVVLAQKLDSIFNTYYPQDKLHVYVGSDSSTDDTNNILERYKAKYPNFHPIMYRERKGKIAIGNTFYHAIKDEAENGILIMTDADVIFQEDTLYHLAKHFKNPQIGMVGANILSPAKKEGIAFQEKSYVHRENMIKYREGIVFGAMMGAFGACYAIRASLFTPVQEHFKSDDFFLTMHVLREHKMAIYELEAIGYEDVPSKAHEEYMRKVRISLGNFQNLEIYKGMLWPPYNAVAFCFWSHKVLRWMGPLFIVLTYIANLFLLDGNKFYQLTFILQNLLLVTPLIDNLLKRMHIEVVIIRFIAYFYYMNLALFQGFIKYLKREQQNVWQPTKRNS